MVLCFFFFFFYVCGLCLLSRSLALFLFSISILSCLLLINENMYLRLCRRDGCTVLSMPRQSSSSSSFDLGSNLHLQSIQKVVPKPHRYRGNNRHRRLSCYHSCKGPLINVGCTVRCPRPLSTHHRPCEKERRATERYIRYTISIFHVTSLHTSPR